MNDIDWAVEPVYRQTDVHGNPLTEEEARNIDNHMNNEMTDPFVKTNWKTVESREAWQHLFQQVGAAKVEAEWRSVMYDETDRKAAIIHVNNNNREKWLRRLGQHDLVYRDLLYTESYEGFSHKHLPTDISNPHRDTYAVVAQNEDIADQMDEATNELTGVEKHEQKGRLLGFPKCCRDFFHDVWLGEDMIDPLYEVACNTDGVEMVDGDPEHLLIPEDVTLAGSNPMWKYFGLTFTTHIPCSFNCEATNEIARQRYRIMVDAGYKRVADMLAQWLELPGTWSGLHSQALVKNEHIIGKSKTSIYPNKKRIIYKREHESGTPLDEGGAPPE